MKRFLVVFGFLAAVIGVGFYIYHNIPGFFNPFYDATTSVTVSDFESKEQLLEFVNSHLPVKLPEVVEVEKLEYVSWLDWNFKATVALKPKDAVAYGQKVDAIKFEDENEDKEFGGFDDGRIHYSIKDSPVIGSIIVDPNTGKIQIECSNDPKLKD